MATLTLLLKTQELGSTASSSFMVPGTTRQERKLLPIQGRGTSGLVCPQVGEGGEALFFKAVRFFCRMKVSLVGRMENSDFLNLF